MKGKHNWGATPYFLAAVWLPAIIIILTLYLVKQCGSVMSLNDIGAIDKTAGLILLFLCYFAVVSYFVKAPRIKVAILMSISGLAGAWVVFASYWLLLILALPALFVASVEAKIFFTEDDSWWEKYFVTAALIVFSLALDLFAMILFE